MFKTSRKSVKTRFAPSPTGFLHLGGLRTALYAYVFAKQHKGEFLLRIEDTDRARYVAEAEKNINETLQTFNLVPDQEPVRQSDRIDVYKKYANELLAKNLAYEDTGAIRFRMPKTGTTKFSDTIRGEIEIENKDQEDFVILKSDGYPTYNLAHLIDDYEMGITHVIRGEEFIPSMPKYIALHEALGWQIPEYAHLPLLLNKNRSKLSKREGDVAVEDYLKKGYLKEAILNFVALLGWHPSQSEKEIYTLQELILEFKLEDVQKAGAIFALDKLNWFQKVWITKLSDESKNIANHPFYQIVKRHLPEASDNFLARLWPHLTERLTAPENYEKDLDEFSFFVKKPDFEAKLLVWKKSDKETTGEVLTKLLEFLKQLPDYLWDKEELENNVKNFISENNWDNGTVLWPLRVALTGREKSMGPFEIMDILNQTENRGVVFERIEKAISILTR
ncbi:MAG: glutamate--tRNA ligase [Candidatus Doudnabacteria bacterium RIFCSPHIGHO2_02_FULL_46_11]|uniref:Glutamate--tRNA ligase n=1 Tax=Candidatus Doudnabacteria bacterium RIFCSPHIGHO2_02_FULL_46_11 TaxID=1817832 RepID=A0A1F5P9U6_9BACT|nr:MAG: glutamate--tRNA ligase [Candidatus Doudnabacteria bacterium RIFCSPHIGHO2_02_FULL_46_11]